VGKATAAPVDYQGAALAEGDAAQRLTEQQTWANRPNQVNPWGTVNWSNSPVWDEATQQNINQWTQTQEMSPALNAALQSQMGLMAGRSQLGYGMMGNIAQSLGQGMNWDQFGNPAQMSGQDLPGLWTNLQQDIPQYSTTGTLDQLNFQGAPRVNSPQFGVQRAEDAIYNRQAARLDPRSAGEKQALEIKLRNQGLTEGDAAWKSAFQDMGMSQNDAYSSAMNDAISGGSQAAQNMFGMESAQRDQYTGEVERAGNFANNASMQEFMQRMQAGAQGFQDTQQAANFQNQSRQQAYNERLSLTDYYNNLRQQMINEETQRRGQGLNEANALISGQQVGLPQFNNFSQAQASQTPQMLAAAQLQGQQNAANASAQNAGINGLMSGLGSAAGMAGMFSDRRLKKNIKKIGESNGTPWYEFDYIWGGHMIGVMADEAPSEAVSVHPSGFLMVDYSKV
jgi:hypothetical protein